MSDLATDRRHDDMLMLVGAANVVDYDLRSNNVATPTVSPSTGDVQKDVAATDARSQSSPAHRCRICQRTYERADHLTRHLKSHTNARPFQCQQCSKSFNRVDLLNRHVTTHERNARSLSHRAEIRRTERAGQACVACAAAKVRCEDEKPCRRCRSKSISCTTSGLLSTKKVSTSKKDHLPRHSRDPDDANLHSPTQPPSIPITHNANENGELDHSRHSSSLSANIALYTTPVAENGMTGHEYTYPTSNEPFILPPENSNEMISSPFNPPVNADPLYDMLFYPALTDFNNQNFDFGFQCFDFEDDFLKTGPILAKNLDIEETAVLESRPKAPSIRDAARGYAAFTRSPWLWTPAPKDHILIDKDDLALDEQTIPSTLTPSSSGFVPNIPSCGFPHLTASLRDSMFYLVSTMKGFTTGIPKFPSLDVLNHIIEAYFLKQSYQLETWIHIPTISSIDVIPELLLALIAAGSTVIAVPAVWKMGLALLDVVRVTTGELWERENTATRKLQPLQAWMLFLNTGLWSGFQRQMELAESFCQPIVTMMRRGGIISALPDTQALVPTVDDVGKVLDIKWRKWASRESFKRLTLQLFLHDARASIALQKNPLISFTEIAFSVPASGALFLAGSAAEWKIKYSEQQLTTKQPLPRLLDAMRDLNMLEDYGDGADLELCYTVLLYSFWGQIWAFRESSKFHINDSGDSVHRLWLTAEQRGLYEEIEDFKERLLAMPNQQPALLITAELFQMILHVSPDELQHFAGKAGEEAASQALSSLERWSITESSRKAVWHAGQIFHWASLMPLAELRDFYAIAVYFGSLTMWTYGHLAPCNSRDAAIQSKEKNQSFEPPSNHLLAILNGLECRQTRTFILKGLATPALTALASSELEGRKESIVMLNDPNEVLEMARNLYRRNFPVLDEPLPPLVENMGNLMRDLRSLPDSRFSRCVSPA